MRMKRILLASAAVAVLAGAHQAQAASDLYVSVFGGANFLQGHSAVDVSTTTNIVGFDIDPDTGFVIGGAIGTNLSNWATGLRVELEASYRRNDIGGTWFRDADIPPTSDTTAGLIDGNMSTFAILANAWYEIDVGSKVRPYVGGGVGWARTRHEAAFIETTDDGTPDSDVRGTAFSENSGFAWQLGLGLNYQVAPDVDVGIGYRYFVGPRISDPHFEDVSDDVVLNNENHTVHVNLTIGIN